MITYEQFAQKTASQKVVLAWVEPSQRLIIWTVHSGLVYKKTLSEFLIGLYEDTDALTEATSIGAVNSPGKYFFDKTTRIVYLWTLNGDDPSDVQIKADYRLFFSTGPFILPYDLTAGSVEVEYLPIISGTSSFGHDLDFEQIGIALEGEGAIALINNDGFFDSKYDKLYFEQKRVVVFSWSPEIELSEIQKLYTGYVIGKQFSAQSVTFQLRDFISKLRNNLALPVFDGTEGTFSDSQLGKIKRRIYGRVSGLKVVPVDNTLDGFELTGTITGTVGSTTVTGSGTNFLDECSPEDELNILGERYKIESVTSDTELEISSDLEINFAGEVGSVDPKIPYRRKNRRWFIAHHALKELSAEIQTVSAANRYNVDTVTDFNAGDQVLVNGQKKNIRRITGNQIVLLTNLVPTASPTDVITRYPVQSCVEGAREFVSIRDFTVDNQVTGSYLEFDELAEFNVTRPLPATGTLTFTNGSRSITGSGTAFKTDLKSRDWIRPVGTIDYFEVLDVVDDITLVLRSPFTGGTVSSGAEKKNVTYLSDDSEILIDCYGKTFDGSPSGEWIKTAADVVEDVLVEAGLDSLINTESFDQARIDASYLMSLKLPLQHNTENAITIRDTLDIVNRSVFGSLHNNNDFEIEFNVVNSRKPPEDLLVIRDDDIIDYQVESRMQDLVKDTIVFYRHLDADRFTGEEASSSYTHSSEFARIYLGLDSQRSYDIFLYDEMSAKTIAQRLGIIYEFNSTRVTVTTKLNLSTKNLNNKVFYSFERLPERFGDNSARIKIGVINSIRKDGANTVVVIDDVGSLWNRVANYTASDAAIYASSEESERAANGYFTDGRGIVNDLDYTFKTNLYG